MRSLPTLVTLTSPLSAMLMAEADGQPAQLRIEQDLAALATAMGVSVGPQVRFASTADSMRGQPLRVDVDGRLCLVPPVRWAEALAYATHSPEVRPGLSSQDLLADGVQPGQLHETL